MPSPWQIPTAPARNVPRGPCALSLKTPHSELVWRERLHQCSRHPVRWLPAPSHLLSVSIHKDGSVSTLVYSSGVRTKYNFMFKAGNTTAGTSKTFNVWLISFSSHPFQPMQRISCPVSLKILIVFVVNADRLGVSSFRSEDELTVK